MASNDRSKVRVLVASLYSVTLGGSPKKVESKSLQSGILPEDGGLSSVKQVKAVLLYFLSNYTPLKNKYGGLKYSEWF